MIENFQGGNFPLFVSLEGKSVLVIGGGKIATRRILSLIEFKPSITVLSPVITSEIFSLFEEGKLQWNREKYKKGMMENYDLIFSAIDNQEIDYQIYQEATLHKIPVNIASNKEWCNFYFPGLVKKDEIVIGISASGKNHKLVRQIKEDLIKIVDKLFYR